MKLLSLNDVYAIHGGESSDREALKDKLNELIDDVADKTREGSDKVNNKIHEIAK